MNVTFSRCLWLEHLRFNCECSQGTLIVISTLLSISLLRGFLVNTDSRTVSWEWIWTTLDKQNLHPCWYFLLVNILELFRFFLHFYNGLSPPKASPSESVSPSSLPIGSSKWDEWAINCLAGFQRIWAINSIYIYIYTRLWISRIISMVIHSDLCAYLPKCHQKRPNAPQRDKNTFWFNKSGKPSSPETLSLDLSFVPWFSGKNLGSRSPSPRSHPRISV